MASPEARAGALRSVSAKGTKDLEALRLAKVGASGSRPSPNIEAEAPQARPLWSICAAFPSKHVCREFANAPCPLAALGQGATPPIGATREQGKTSRTTLFKASYHALVGTTRGNPLAWKGAPMWQAQSGNLPIKDVGQCNG